MHAVGAYALSLMMLLSSEDCFTFLGERFEPLHPVLSAE